MTRPIAALRAFTVATLFVGTTLLAGCGGHEKTTTIETTTTEQPPPVTTTTTRTLQTH